MKTHAQKEKDRYIAATSESASEREREGEKDIAWKEEEAKMRAEICATFAQKTF